MLKLLAWLVGWKIDPTVPEGAQRSVMVAAPHTSNWDGFYMLLACLTLGIRFKFALKKELTRFPFGLLLKPLGALGIDRSPKKPGESKPSQVEAMARLFEGQERMVMIVAPEGSRSRLDKWRTGFYHVALLAGVPISFGYLDYKNKRAGIAKVFYPTGDVEADIAKIQEFYKDITPRYPHKSIVSAANDLPPKA